MNNKKIIDALKNAAKEQNINIDSSKVNFDAPLKEIGIDSITALNIIVTIEQSLGVRVPDDELSSLTTINLLIKEFEKLLK